ncbi:DUF1627 domain-containing protein, partial [Escherichia coli]
LALRRAKSDVQKWERVCAALRELNKHRDIFSSIADIPVHSPTTK